MIIIPGNPIAQIRMKFSGRNGIGRVYDPRAKDKNLLKKFIACTCKSWPKFEHPRVSFIFHMPIPKSLPKKLLSAYNSGFLKHEKKPDTDNFIKLYLDCMDGIVFDGDQKVMLGPSVKLYHPLPKTIILISEKQDILQEHEVDPLTWLALTAQEYGKYSSFGKDSLPDS